MILCIAQSPGSLVNNEIYVADWMMGIARELWPTGNPYAYYSLLVQVLSKQA